MDIIAHFTPKTAGYTFFSSAQETFSRTDHILGHRTSLSKFKKTEIISNIFSDNSGMKLENYRKKTEKESTNTWRVNMEGINHEIKTYLETK